MTGQFTFDETKGWGGTDPDTNPTMFMSVNGIDTATMRDALVEYRNLDTGYPESPWERDEIGVLSTDFVNWFRWERL